MDVPDHKFSENEVLTSKHYRDNQPGIRLKVRFIALLMLAKGIGFSDIASVVGKSAKTIENWHRQYIPRELIA